MSSRKPGIRASIWACSDGPTTSGGVCRACWSTASGNRRRFMTVHHIGTVLANASGMLLPRRVESTMMQLSFFLISCDWV